MKPVPTSVLTCLTALALGLGACNDEFLERKPLDTVTDVSFWQNEEHVRLATNATYAYLKGKNTVDMENMGDNTVWPTVTEYQRISTGNYGADVGALNTEWNDDYAGIQRCNQFLENYQKANMNAELKERYAAEVRFMRVYLYSYLTALFGDVQFITKTIPVSDPAVYGTREKKAVVVDWMLKELDELAPKLPLTYPPTDYGRITRGAALALKSRIALFEGRFDLAEQAAKAVMDLNTYQLYSNGDPKTSYRELFTYKGQAAENSANRETILARVYVKDVSMHNMSREVQVPDQAIRWNPTKSLVDAYLCSDGLPIDKSPLYAENAYTDYFKNRDPRLVQTILSPGSAWGGLDDGDADNNPNAVYNLPKFKADKKGAVTVTGFYFTKYVEVPAVGLVSRDENDFHLIRYAEVLLNYAEARLEQGKLTQADVDATINKLRSRVGMVPMKLDQLSTQGLTPRTELRRERRVELALEGQRYFDILRWKQGDVLTQDVKGIKRAFAPNQSDVSILPVDAQGYILFLTGKTFTAPKNYLWPIPFVQRERNPNLGQNPGW